MHSVLSTVSTFQLFAYNIYRSLKSAKIVKKNQTFLQCISYKSQTERLIILQELFTHEMKIYCSAGLSDNFSKKLQGQTQKLFRSPNSNIIFRTNPNVFNCWSSNSNTLFSASNKTEASSDFNRHQLKLRNLQSPIPSRYLPTLADRRRYPADTRRYQLIDAVTR